MAATITYKYPVSGTVAPTLAQALAANTVIAEVVMADADTTAAITHNFQTTTAELAQYFPSVSIYNNGSGTAAGTVIATLTNSVAVTLTKSTAAGSAVTAVVQISRPHTIVR